MFSTHDKLDCLLQFSSNKYEDPTLTQHSSPRSLGKYMFSKKVSNIISFPILFPIFINSIHIFNMPLENIASIILYSKLMTLITSVTANVYCFLPRFFFPYNKLMILEDWTVYYNLSKQVIWCLKLLFWSLTVPKLLIIALQKK